ncbi:MAG: hypothetical protein ACF8K1_10420 [Phycisphaerales bacterium JB047]
MKHAWGCFLSIVLFAVTATAQTPPEHWAQDLDYLAEQLLARHPNFYTKHTVEEFEDALDALYNTLDELDDQQIVMELGRLISLGGDAHTTVGMGEIGSTMKRLPVQLLVLEDGVFVSSALAEHDELVSQRVVSINTVPIGEVIERVSVLFAYENRSKQIGSGAWYATLLPALRAVGVIKDHQADEIPVLLEHNGKQTKHMLPCLPQTRGQQWVSFVQQLPQPWPLAFRKQRGYYQSDFIAEHKAMYVAYNRCREAEDLPMAEFVEFIMTKSDELDAQRIIIDLRFNGGGDETVIWPLWQALEKSERFSDKGNIIGLISRQTFSSAMSNSHQLRDNCGAVLIGEPTGGKPNHFGQLSSFTLPNTGITISHSTKWFQKVEGDPDAVHPDVLIPWRSAPLFSGEDPALEAALTYEPAG